MGNRSIGTAAAGGMLIGTIFGVLVIPGLYYLFAVLSERTKPKSVTESVAIADENTEQFSDQ